MNRRSDGRSGAGGRDTSALRRTRGSSQRRLVRSIVLGTLAVAGAITWLAMKLGMDRRELVDYALTSLMLVVAMVVVAVVGALLVWGIKRLVRRR